MHLADGILTAPVAVGAAVAAAGGIAIGLRRIDPDDLPKVGVLAAVFFIASLIHVPVGISSAHLLMNGLAGLLLGWGAFPAIAAALLLQAILFHFGGIVSLGANTLNMSLPAVLSYYLFAPHIRAGGSPTRLFALGAAGGALSIFGAGVMLSLTLLATGRDFVVAAAAVLIAHIPIMLAEAVVTGAAISFLGKVRPETLPTGRVAA